MTCKSSAGRRSFLRLAPVAAAGMYASFVIFGKARVRMPNGRSTTVRRPRGKERAFIIARAQSVPEVTRLSEYLNGEGYRFNNKRSQVFLAASNLNGPHDIESIVLEFLGPDDTRSATITLVDSPTKPRDIQAALYTSSTDGRGARISRLFDDNGNIGVMPA